MPWLKEPRRRWPPTHRRPDRPTPTRRWGADTSVHDIAEPDRGRVRPAGVRGVAAGIVTVGTHSKQEAVVHRYDEQVTVGCPAEPGRTVRDLHFVPDRSRLVKRVHHPSSEHVREPEEAVVPAEPLRPADSLGHGRSSIHSDTSRLIPPSSVIAQVRRSIWHARGLHQ